ncbi:hypothetical protein H311_01580 [Anncaliia algerae PRA109]|nr:hypothetical protein H311_01580 [Anncaliia algerae PRA109]
MDKEGSIILLFQLIFRGEMMVKFKYEKCKYIHLSLVIPIFLHFRKFCNCIIFFNKPRRSIDCINNSNILIFLNSKKHNMEERERKTYETIYFLIIFLIEDFKINIIKTLEKNVNISSKEFILFEGYLAGIKKYI